MTTTATTNPSKVTTTTTATTATSKVRKKQSSTSSQSQQPQQRAKAGDGLKTKHRTSRTIIVDTGQKRRSCICSNSKRCNKLMTRWAKISPSHYHCKFFLRLVWFLFMFLFAYFDRVYLPTR